MLSDLIFLPNSGLAQWRHVLVTRLLWVLQNGGHQISKGWKTTERGIIRNWFFGPSSCFLSFVLTMIMLSLRIMLTSSTGWYALLSTCWRRTEVLRVAWWFAFVFLLNRRAHRLRMTLGCGPLKTAPLICHRPMTVNQRYCFKFHLQCLIKQDSLFATLLLWQPFIPEMNLLRQFAVITIGRKVQTTERSCWAVKRITKNQIPCQITKRIAKMISSLLISISISCQMPFLSFVPDGQTAEVTVQARTEWKMKSQKTPHTNKARAKNEKKLH